MALRDKVQETISTTMNLRRDTDDVFVMTLHTEVSVVRTMCILAGQETGHERTNHIHEAEKAFQGVIKIAKRVQLRQQDRHGIEQARRDILSLGGNDS